MGAFLAEPPGSPLPVLILFDPVGLDVVRGIAVKLLGEYQ
jgi:hypothetical protein